MAFEPLERPVAPVILDAMGGDLAPLEVIRGAIDSVRHDATRVILVGDEVKVTDIVLLLGARDLLENKSIQITPAACAVAMDEKPSVALRKRDSSMRIACDLVASGQGCGALSAGNSGAMMAIALISVGRLENVLRPAIATLMPSQKGFSIVADAGANIDCTPQMLLQFAVFGSAFAKGVFGLEQPRVGLLSNGEEDTKGSDLTRAALELIRSSDLLTDGYCEGADVFKGYVDVVVCDGFSGNILLKTAEGTARYFAKSLKDNVTRGGWMSKVGAFLMSDVFAQVKKRMDSREYGAAPLLGLKAPVFIAHGNSDAFAIRNAIRFVRDFHKGQVEHLIEAGLARNAQLFKVSGHTRESRAEA